MEFLEIRELKSTRTKLEKVLTSSYFLAPALSGGPQKMGYKKFDLT